MKILLCLYHFSARWQKQIPSNVIWSHHHRHRFATIQHTPEDEENELFFLLSFFCLFNFSRFQLARRHKRAPWCAKCIRNPTEILSQWLLPCSLLLLLQHSKVQNAFIEAKEKLIFHLSTRGKRTLVSARLLSSRLSFTNSQLLTYTCTIRKLNLTNMNGLKHYFLLCYFY